MNNVDLIFTERLKELRKAHGYTQDELAKQLGIARTSISGYERGDRKPDLEMLCKIAALFNKPVDYLIGNSNLDKVDNNLLLFLNNLNSSDIEKTLVDLYNANSTTNLDDDIFKNLLINFIKLINKSLNITSDSAECEEQLLKLFISCLAIQNNKKFESKDIDLLTGFISEYCNNDSIKEIINLNSSSRSDLIKLLIIFKLPYDIQTRILRIIGLLELYYRLKGKELSDESYLNLLIKSLTNKAELSEELDDAINTYESLHLSLLNTITDLKTIKNNISNTKGE